MGLDRFQSRIEHLCPMQAAGVQLGFVSIRSSFRDVGTCDGPCTRHVISREERRGDIIT